MNTKILVIEDDVDVRDTLQRLLSAMGYDVRVAVDGATAMRILREGWTPRVILLDLMMPNMDGYRFREAQLETPELAGIATIVVTADRRANPASMGAAAWFTKPFDPGALLAAIKQQSS